MRRAYFTIPILASILIGGIYFYVTKTNINPDIETGNIIDNFEGVNVFFNGGVNNSSGRLLTPDGYNLGIKYQCVEFIKRYYYQRFNHKMPDSMGHAKHFFDPLVLDGNINTKRDLVQFKNGSPNTPKVDDIIVFSPTILNPYGHVAIISNVFDNTIQIVQQNAGPFSSSRAYYKLINKNGLWYIEGKKTLGWLRLRAANL